MTLPSLEQFELILPLDSEREARSWLGRDRRERSDSLSLVQVEQFTGEFLERDDLRREIVAEVEGLGELDHSLIHPTIAAGRLDETFSVVHEFPSGEPLAELLGETNFEIPMAMRIIADVVEGLAEAHEEQIVHGALHPGPLYVAPSGRTRLARFGSEKLVRRARHNWGRLNARQLSYLSPEHCTNDRLDRSTDIFNLGTLFWELLTGEILFREEDEFERMRAICEQEAPPPSRFNDAVPPLLNSLILKALATDRSQRFPHAGKMREVFRGVLERTDDPASAGAVSDRLQEISAHRSQRWRALEESRRAGQLEGVVECAAELFEVDLERVRAPAPGESATQTMNRPIPPTDRETEGDERQPEAEPEETSGPEADSRNESGGDGRTRTGPSEKKNSAPDDVFEGGDFGDGEEVPLDEAFDSVSDGDWLEESEAGDFGDREAADEFVEGAFERAEGDIEETVDDQPSRQTDEADPSPERTGDSSQIPASAREFFEKDADFEAEPAADPQEEAVEPTRELDEAELDLERDDETAPAEKTTEPPSESEREEPLESESSGTDGARPESSPDSEPTGPATDLSPRERPGGTVSAAAETDSSELDLDALGADLEAMSIDDWLEEERDREPFEEPFPLEHVIEDRGDSEQTRVRKPALEIISLGPESPLEVSVLRGRQTWAHEDVPMEVESRGDSAVVRLEPPSSGWVARADDPGRRDELPDPPTEIELNPGDVAEISDEEVTYRFRYFHPPKSPDHIQRRNAGRTVGTYAVAAGLALLFHVVAALGIITVHETLNVTMTVQEDPKKEVFAEGKLKKFKEKKKKKQPPPEPPEPPPEPTDPAEQKAKVPENVQQEINEKLENKQEQAEDKTEAEALAAALDSSNDDQESVTDAVRNIDAVDSPSGSESEVELGGKPTGTEGSEVKMATGSKSGSELGEIADDIGGETGDLSERDEEQTVRGTVDSVASNASVEGTLARSKISRIINEHQGQIQGCYEQQLLQNPNLGGKITFEWTITRSGDVSGARQSTSSLGSAAVSNCILGIIREMSFPKPKGGSVSVTYPFMFQSSG